MDRRAFSKQFVSLTAGMLDLPRMGVAAALRDDYGVSSTSSSAGATLPIELHSEKHVFVDWRVIEAGYGLAFTPAQQKAGEFQPRLMPYGVKLSVMSPVIDAAPIIMPDTPADGIFIGAYSTVIQDDGKYRLWYEGYEALRSDVEAKICYAESDDGRRWMKPSLGLIEFKGSRQNNIVYLGGHGATIFRDPSAPASERYKLIHVHHAPAGERPAAWVFGAVSSDGLLWKRLNGPILKHTSDTQSVCTYDSKLNRYLAYLRGWEPQAPTGYGGRRVIARAESVDFRRWSTPEIVLAPGPADPPDLDIYTNAYQRWPGAADAHLMLPAFYHRAADRVDVHLAVSRNGVGWSRPSEYPLLPFGPANSDFGGQVYAGVGIVSLGPGIWAFPVWRSGLTHNMVYPQYFKKDREGSIWFATLREDGLMALEAETEGECWTQEVTFTGSQFLVNASGSLGGRLLVELAAPDGKPLPGYALEDCDVLHDDVLWKPVRWGGKTDVSALAGKPVRIRFHLTRCCLYAFRFS